MSRPLDRPEEELLHAYYDGELTGLARLRFERRMRSSTALQAELGALSALGELVRRTAAVGPEPDLWDDLALRLPAVDARRAEAKAGWSSRGMWGSGSLGWLLRPALLAATGAVALALGIGLLWPAPPVAGSVVRWIDAGGRDVLVIDDAPDTTIIWMLDPLVEGEAKGGGRGMA
jgi:anti-sigma factor RsiW